MLHPVTSPLTAPATGTQSVRPGSVADSDQSRITLHVVTKTKRALRWQKVPFVFEFCVSNFQVSISSVALDFRGTAPRKLRDAELI